MARSTPSPVSTPSHPGAPRTSACTTAGARTVGVGDDGAGRQTTLNTLEQVRTLRDAEPGLPPARLREPSAATDRQPRREVRRLPRRHRPGGPLRLLRPGRRRYDHPGRACAGVLRARQRLCAGRSTASPRSNSLKVTAAHEFFHAIQFAYDVDEDLWFMEGSATWVEDEVYDSINDNYQFLAVQPDPVPPATRPTTGSTWPPTAPSCSSGMPAERLRSRDIVRQFWKYADATAEPVLAPGDPRRDGRPADELDEPTSPSSPAGTRSPPAATASARATRPPCLTLNKTLSSGRAVDRLANGQPAAHVAAPRSGSRPSSTLSTRKKRPDRDQRAQHLARDERA